jgi:hypothetical protein
VIQSQADLSLVIDKIWQGTGALHAKDDKISMVPKNQNPSKRYLLIIPADPY